MGKVKWIDSKGFTLVEVMAVIVIVGILTGIAVLSVNGIIENSRVEVCHVNTQEVERMYEANLALEGMEHSDALFNQYLSGYEGRICPVDGEVTYVDGQVQCSVHPRDLGEEDAGDEGVPFL